MKTRTNISYFWKEGISNIFLHGFMSFAAVSIILVCLLITGSVALISYNINFNIIKLQEDCEIVLFIDDTVLSSEQAQALESEIIKIDNIRSAEFQPRVKALEDYRKTLGENAGLLDGFDEKNNPIRDGYHVRLKDVSRVGETKAALQDIKGVATVNVNEDTIGKLLKVQRVFQLISFGLVLALGAISIFIIANTVKLAMFTRRNEIAIQKMVGATDGFICWPFVIEGLVLGLVAGTLAFLAQWGVYTELSNTVTSLVPSFQMAAFESFRGKLFEIFLISGSAVGVGGSVLSMHRFLDV